MNFKDIRKGTQVYSYNNQVFGTVEDVTDEYVVINGQRYGVDAFSRYDNNILYLVQTQDQGGNVVRVPLYEERLDVSKRQTQVGEVELHKTVVTEQRNVPVQLSREEVQVESRDLPDRAVRPGEDVNLFQEGTIRVALQGEEAVVSKQAYVTGEVDLTKTRVTENQTISDTVRREQVEVNDSRTATTGATYDYTQIPAGTEVYGSDNTVIGRVKQVTNQYLVVERKGHHDVHVPFNAITSTTAQGLLLNVATNQVDSQHWS